VRNLGRASGLSSSRARRRLRPFSLSHRPWRAPLSQEAPNREAETQLPRSLRPAEPEIHENPEMGEAVRVSLCHPAG
jgi:hypothetical protein